MNDDLDLFFQGLDTVSCKAGGIEFEALYDESFYSEELGGAVFGDNAPVITTQARFVRGMGRGDEIEVVLPRGGVVFRVLDFPREDGAGLAFVPLSRQ